LSTAFRASGYIYFQEYSGNDHSSNIIYQINRAYGTAVEIEREVNNHWIVRVDIYGSNGIDYDPLQDILKENRKYISEEIAIQEWVESDGGFIFDPEDEEIW